MKTHLLAIFLLISQPLLSQNLIELYENYIPKIIIKAYDSREAIELNLNYNAKLQPELNYYYLLYLRNLFENKITNPDSNYFNCFKYHQTKYLKLRSSWADFQIQNIEKLTDVRLKRNTMIAFYQDLKFIPYTSPIEEINLFVDDNVREFIIYLFYTRQKSVYDVTKDYYQMNKDIVSAKIQQLNNDYENFANFNFDQKLNSISNDNNYWYLIGNDSANKYSTSANYDAYELNVKTFNTYFLTRNAFSFGIGINLLPNILPEFSNNHNYQDMPLPSFTQPIRYDFQLAVSSDPLVRADLVYQFALKPELDILSYLKVKLGYTFMVTNYGDENKDKEFYKFTYNYVSASEKQIYSYRSNGVKNNSNNFFYFQISTPLFYLSKMIYFELGLETSLWLIKYDYQVEKQSVREIDGERTVESREYTNFSFEHQRLNISPNLAIVVEPISNLNFCINSTFIRRSFSLNIGTNYFL